MNFTAPDIRNWSIKNKLKAIIILTSLVVLLLLFLFFVLSQEMNSLARNLANNSAASIIFGDHPSANETLESLKFYPQVASGIIFDTEGRIFSSYHKQDDLASLPTYPSPALLDAGHLFSRHYLDSVHPIRHETEELGLLYLRANLTPIENILLRYIGFGVMGLGVAFVLAWVLAVRLQRVISQPIDQLAAAMKSVSKERNYNQRVKIESHDELGSLIEDFNEMLAQIENRDQELRNKQNRLDYLAHHDTLTNLPNRLLFQDRLHHAITKARRMQQTIALFFLDLDRFKNINDSLGHDVGDQILQEVAKRLTSIVRESDTLARLGGDEFVITLEQNAESSKIIIAAQKILQTLSTAFHIDANELYITTSIGISLYPDNGLTSEALMKTADMAMYRAKEKGRNNFQFFTLSMNERAHEALFLENNLHTAIDNQELALYYQPQVKLSTGKISGMEALVRWHHPKHGVIPPNKFIPMTEETGLIIPLDKWVINTACQQTKKWQQAGFPPCKVAVNIFSPGQPGGNCNASLG